MVHVLLVMSANLDGIPSMRVVQWKEPVRVPPLVAVKEKFPPAGLVLLGLVPLKDIGERKVVPPSLRLCMHAYALAARAKRLTIWHLRTYQSIPGMLFTF